MEFLKFTIANLLGTSLMTVFTYCLSEILNKQYKQPILIAYFQDIFRIELSRTAKRVVGWLLHYCTGAIFLLLFHLYWKFDDALITWPSGLLLGALAGFAGMVIWKICFTVVKEKQIPEKGFYIHIFFAHIIFALGIVAAYQLMARF